MVIGDNLEGGHMMKWSSDAGFISVVSGNYFVLFN